MIERSALHRRTLAAAFVLVAAAFMIEWRRSAVSPLARSASPCFLVGAAFQCLLPFLI